MSVHVSIDVMDVVIQTISLIHSGFILSPAESWSCDVVTQHVCKHPNPPDVTSVVSLRHFLSSPAAAHGSARRRTRRRALPGRAEMGGEAKWTVNNSMIGEPSARRDNLIHRMLTIGFISSASLPSALVLPAGAGGGLVASVATCPLDVVKTKLQAQRAKHGDAAYRGVFGTLIITLYVS